MKKYLQNRKCEMIKCDECGIDCSKPCSEIKRNTSLGRKMFCSRKCSVIYGNKTSPYHTRDHSNIYDISQHSNNLKDEFTPFRYLLASCRSRYKEFNLTLQDIMDIWKEQNGICPYTGINLELRTYKNPCSSRFKQASVDRIDSNKGYTKDNIEIISMPINFLKSTFTREEVIKYLKEISNFTKNL